MLFLFHRPLLKGSQNIQGFALMRAVLFYLIFAQVKTETLIFQTVFWMTFKLNQELQQPS